MKKISLLVCIFLFSVVLQGRVRKIITPEKPVVKTLQFSVFAATDYSTAPYKRSKAKVLLSVWKFKGSEQELVWHSLIDPGKLKNYPDADDALFRQIRVYNVKECSETYVMGYKIVYDSKGSKLEYDKGYLVPQGDTTKHISIPV